MTNSIGFLLFVALVIATVASVAIMGLLIGKIVSTALELASMKWAYVLSKTSHYEPREAFDQAYEDARLDTIRDELEAQTAPNRPHIRSAK